MGIHSATSAFVPAGNLSELTALNLQLLSSDGISFAAHPRADHGRVDPPDLLWMIFREGDGLTCPTVMAVEFSGGFLVWTSKLTGDARFEVKQNLC